MQPSDPPRKKTRHQKACTECQRRKQKCLIPRPGGPCSNCLKRYPPVECIFSQKDAPRSRSAHAEAEDAVTTTAAASAIYLEVPVLPSSDLVLLGGPPTGWDTPTSFGNSSAGSSRAETPDEEWRPPERGTSPFVLSGRGISNAPRPFGGLFTDVTSAIGRQLPMEATPRNVELFHFFFRYVTPNLVSIDGEHTPQLFVDQMLPWMLQSPIMPRIALLSSATTQSLQLGLEVNENSELVHLKSSVLSRVNEYLRMDFDMVATEVLRSVIHLVIMEWFWGDDQSMWAHLRGVREMVRMRGGFAFMRDPLLATVLTYTDYMIAGCHETDIYLLEDDPMREFDIPLPPVIPERLSSPLIAWDGTFEGTRECWSLSAETARILDDVRFLTLLITAPTKGADNAKKVQTTAAWLYDRIRAAAAPRIVPHSSEADLIHSMIRSAALIYTWSIMQRKRISQYEDPRLVDELRARWTRVSVARWKGMMGISQWLLLVACPGSGTDTKGKFLRRKMGVTGMSIGMEVFPLTIACCKAFWRVQRWIAGGEVDALVEELILGEAVAGLDAFTDLPPGPAL